MKLEPQGVARSVRSLLPELPSLVDGDPAPLTRGVEECLEIIEGEDKRADDAVVELLGLLLEHPRAHARFVELLPSQARVTTRSTGEAPVASPALKRHVDLSCPREVFLDTPRIQVVVRLRVEATEHTVEDLELKLDGSLPVVVRLEAPGFAPLTRPEQSVPVLDSQDSPPLVFDLVPRALGHTRVTCELFQGGHLLGTCSVAVEITARKVPHEETRATLTAVSVTPEGEPPDLTLSIAHERFRPEPRLVFTLRQAGQAARTFHPVKLRSDPARHAAELYSTLTDLVDADHSEDGRRVDRQVKRLGLNIWRELIPRELKELFRENRQRWRGKSLMVLSDEPHIPWELVWPYTRGQGEDAEPWCMSFRFSRWLRRDDQGEGHEAPPTRLDMSAVACVSTADSNLEETLTEHAYMQKLIERRGAQDVSPTAGTVDEVERLLLDGGYRWLHVAAHGEYSADNPSSDSVLRLQDDEELTPMFIVGSAEDHIYNEHPSFVFNACHAARQGWTLTRLGGWANRLIGSGSALFMAPMWTVSDKLALRFCQGFYEALTAGETAAEAVRKGRVEARESGDPTWLAYSVYAHPNARLRQA